jgi:hypothetical protein
MTNPDDYEDLYHPKGPIQGDRMARIYMYIDNITIEEATAPSDSPLIQFGKMRGTGIATNGGVVPWGH